jgi:hypothetical protein
VITYSNSRCKKGESILKYKWPRNDFDIEDDAYKLQALAYSKEMDQLKLANNITNY